MITNANFSVDISFRKVRLKNIYTYNTKIQKIQIFTLLKIIFLIDRS